MISLASSRQNSANVRLAHFLSNVARHISGHRRNRSKMSLIIGLVFRRSLTSWSREWHVVDVNELRELRRDAGLSQRQLANLLDIPVNSPADRI